jgi:hypothetical protein
LVSKERAIDGIISVIVMMVTMVVGMILMVMGGIVLFDHMSKGEGGEKGVCTCEVLVHVPWYA